MTRWLLCGVLLALRLPSDAVGQGRRIGATCRDGTTSSATGSGACSHHGGVASWRYVDDAAARPQPVKSDSAGGKPALATKAAVKVWVNRSSGVYHCPGSQYYGKTRNGYYATEREATESGKRAAYGKSCS